MECPIPSYKRIPVLHFFFLSFYTLSPIPLRSSIRFLVCLPLQIFCGPVRSLRLPPAIQDIDLLHWDSQHLNVPRMCLPPLRRLSTNKSPTASPAVSDASTALPIAILCLYANLPIHLLPPSIIHDSCRFSHLHFDFSSENRPICSHPNFFFPSFCLPFSVTPVTRRSPSKCPKEGPLWPSRGPGYTYYGPITLPLTFTTFYHSHYHQPRKHMNRFRDRPRIVQVASRRIPHDTKHKTRK